MERIVVTDIFGNTSIDDTTPFILIRAGNPEKLVYYLDGEDNKRVFRFDPKGIYYVLKKHGLNPNSYVYCGDLFNEKNYFETTNFLLVNKKYTTVTTEFLKLKTFANGAIYTPVAPSGYNHIGLVYSHRGFRPVKAFVVYSDILKNSNYSIGTLGRANEYHYIGSNSENNLTIDKKKVFELSNIKHKMVNDEESLDSIESIDSWINRKGKSVILVTPDTPWFIKKGKKSHHIYTNPKPIFKHNPVGQSTNINYDLQNKAKYKTSQTIDPSRFDLGYGYSYADRLQGVGCKTKEVNSVYEMFNNPEENSKTVKILTVIMIFLIFLLVFITFINLSKDLSK